MYRQVEQVSVEGLLSRRYNRHRVSIAVIIGLLIFIFARLILPKVRLAKTFNDSAAIAYVVIFAFGLSLYRVLFYQAQSDDPKQAPARAALLNANASSRPSSPLQVGQTEYAKQLAPEIHPRIQRNANYSGTIDVISTDPKDTSKSIIDIPDGSFLYVTGWVADTKNKRPAAGLALVIDGQYVNDWSSKLGGERPDLGKAFESTRLNKSGFFNIPVTDAGLSSGSHSIQAGALNARKDELYLVGEARQFEVL